MKKRIVSIEVLRILAMAMVVTLHFLSKGNYLPEAGEPLGAVGYLAWMLESLSIFAVNIYVLISAYFMTESKFRTGRLLSLWLQVEFYSLLIFGVLVLSGRVSLAELSTHDKLMFLLPISMEHYWFLSAYMVMFLLAPFLNAAVHHMNQKQHGILLCFLVFVFSGLKSLLPVQIELPGEGYDALWFLVLYLIGAYLRLYDLSFFKKRSRAVIGYFLAAVAVFTEYMMLRRLYESSGRLERLVSVSMEYNHLFVLAGAVCLFLAFVPTEPSLREGKGAKIICTLSPFTLGVYLLHEHLLLRLQWPGMLGVTGAASPAGLLLNWGIAMAVLFAAGMALDYVRTLLFRGGKHLLRNSRMTKRIGKIDEAVNSLP